MAKATENTFLQDKNGDLFLDCTQLSYRKGYRRVGQSELTDDRFDTIDAVPAEMKEPKPKASATKAATKKAAPAEAEEGWE